MLCKLEVLGVLGGLVLDKVLKFRDFGGQLPDRGVVVWGAEEEAEDGKAGYPKHSCDGGDNFRPGLR